MRPRTLTLFVLPACVAAVTAIDAACFAASPQTIPPAAIKRVAVIVDAGLGKPARYGVGKLEDALRARDVVVSEAEDQVGASDLVLLTGLANAHGAAAAALAELKAAASNGAEALCVRTDGPYQGKPAIVVAGSDDVGLMYAALDLADRDRKSVV